MAGEQVINFATSALAASITASATTLAVTATQGALFSASNFLITIDSEILLITSRTGDSFTIGQRGYDGTTAASHSSAAAVQESFCAYHLKHLWQNVADTYTPLVPPAYQPAGLSPSSWDNEFESLGSWTLFPTSAASGSTWNVNTSLRSHLLMDRGATDNSLYSAYLAFNPTASTPFQVTMKLAMAASFLQAANTNDQLQCFLFVSDQTNPTASTTGGNRFYLKSQFASDVNTSGAGSFANAYADAYAVQVVGGSNVSGAQNSITPSVTPSPGQPLYLRMSFDGANTYTAYIGDGLVYWPIASKSSLGFTPQTLGVQFTNYVPSGSGYPGTCAVDYVRVVVGSGINPRFGN